MPLTRGAELLHKRFMMLTVDDQSRFLRENGIATEVTSKDRTPRRKALNGKAFRKYLERTSGTPNS